MVFVDRNFGERNVIILCILESFRNRERWNINLDIYQEVASLQYLYYYIILHSSIEYLFNYDY